MSNEARSRHDRGGSVSRRWCEEHRNGYDDCSWIHSARDRAKLPPSRFVVVPLDDEDHGMDCICPGACQRWVETNAGLGFHEDGTPREPNGGVR